MRRIVLGSDPRRFIGAATIAAISFAAVPAATAAGSQPNAGSTHAYCAKTKNVTTTALIAGSSHYLAYALGKKTVLTSGDQLKEEKCRLPVFVGKQYLRVRSRSGQTRSLGLVPRYIAGGGGTLIGSMLYDVSVGYNTPEGFVPHLYWWSLAKGTHGKLTIPDGYVYQGGAPDGFMLAKGKTLYVESVHGMISKLGVPFPNSDDPPGESFLSTIATERGVVASREGDFEYMRFAKPNHWTPLDVNGKGLICPTISRTSLGCYSVADDDSGMKHQRTELIRLNGDKPISDKTGGGNTPALAGDVLMYWADGGPKSYSPEARQPIQGPARFQFGEEQVYALYEGPYSDLERDWISITSALGGVVLVNIPRTKVMIFSDAQHHRTLFRVPASDR